MVAENCSGGGGGGGAAVDSEEMNEEESREKLGGGWTPFPELQCGAETPRSLVEHNLLSH